MNTNAPKKKNSPKLKRLKEQFLAKKKIADREYRRAFEILYPQRSNDQRKNNKK